MRMWMVDPGLMCNRHILGEHGELHKFLHNWKKKHSVAGRVADNQIEPLSYKSRHDALAKEMFTRGMNHKSPLEQPDFSYLPNEHLHFKVDVESNLELLYNRCSECKCRREQHA